MKLPEEHGVKKIGLEMHPGFVVYNTETLLKLRNAAGEVIGANFDPSHLFWQGIDPIAFVSNLRMVGYDHVLSIEHEDSLMNVNEGFSKAVSFLKEILLTEKVGEMWWA